MPVHHFGGTKVSSISRTIHINIYFQTTFVMQLSGIITMREDSSFLLRSRTKKEKQLGDRWQDTPVEELLSVTSYQAAFG